MINVICLSNLDCHTQITIFQFLSIEVQPTNYSVHLSKRVSMNVRMNYGKHTSFFIIVTTGEVLLTLSIKRNTFFFLERHSQKSQVKSNHLCMQIHMQSYTGWPRKNATTLIVNLKNIVDETELFFNLFGRTFIFQQNDTMIINFG